MSIEHRKLAIEAEQIDDGTLTDVDNETDRYVGHILCENPSYRNMRLFVKAITDGSVAPGTSMNLTLTFGFCYEEITTPATNAPVQLQTLEETLTCVLPNSTSATRYYQTSLAAPLHPSGKHLYVWLACDNLGAAITVNVYLTRL